ncbi:MAG: T9SS C-terminal target domain-containing protein, partial [Sphingobacteriia bacterium]|nr:T9SS C-terminal target domain-containing protein [Candidatus Fonsibacter lacus]
MKKVIILLVSFTSISLLAREKAPGEETSSIKINQRVLANCAAPKASKEFWVNNVRTIIFTGGDMWWDRDGNTNAYYYIPAVQNRNNGISSSFAGSIWLGGLDAGGQLKVAAMTYRQNGIDFWPGPLDTINASADPTECSKYDQVYTVSRNEVDNFVAGGPITPGILNWPGNGDVSKQQGRRIAPFIDVNSDGLYDPTGGDYPAYDIQNLAEKNELGFCKTKLFGDNTLFWIFNDKGGIHTETQGVPIGVEVRAQAFGFKTNDEINNMTFYSYEVFNRSSFQLNSTYFTIWNDADLGYYLDDYVGCDVKRGLGYIYNADPFDESASGVNGYQDYPPSLGCDFFKGPLADIGDKIDNDQDGITDEPGETIQMSRFTYYNNNIGAFPPQTTNPDIAIHYYNYMTGFWKDGSNFTIGGNAYGGTSPATYVYDGNPVKNTGWTEKASGNLPGDRRFLQSAGPFTLKPGAVNEITFGMPWAQSPSKGGNMQSLELLFSADDKAQALFDNCFKLLDGPEAPNLTIQEMNNELIFYLTNEKGKSNNFKRYNNDYEEEDISIVSDPTSTITALSNPDKNYRFEGYIVYQVKNDGVTSTDLSDRTKAIPVFQCDVANNFSRLVNYEIDNNVGGYVPKVKVDGANKGISSTFKITDDAFSTLENRKLVNNKTYYFVTVAYAHNEYLTYAPDVPVSISSSANLMGQKKPYLEGRKLKRAAGIPHNIDAEKGGTIAQSVYGFGPKITRKEGQGN